MRNEDARPDEARGDHASEDVRPHETKAGSPGGAAAGILVVLAVLGLTGFLVARLSTAATPAVIAGVLAAFAGVLAAVPPIIKALRGR